MNKLRVSILICTVFCIFMLNPHVKLCSQNRPTISEIDSTKMTQHTIKTNELIEEINSSIDKDNFLYGNVRFIGDIDFTSIKNTSERFELIFKYCEFEGDFKVNESILNKNITFIECLFKTSSAILFIPIDISLNNLMILSGKLGWEYIQILINNYNYKAQDIKLISKVVSKIDGNILDLFSVSEYVLLVNKFKKQNPSLIYKYDSNKLTKLMKVMYYLKDKTKTELELEELNLIAEKFPDKKLLEFADYSTKDIQKLINLTKYLNIKLDKFYPEDLYELADKIDKSDFEKFKRYEKPTEVKKLMTVINSISSKAHKLRLDDLDIISKRVKEEDLSELSSYKEQEMRMLAQISYKHYGVYNNIRSYLSDTNRLRLIYNNLNFISSLSQDEQLAYIDFLTMGDFEQFIDVVSNLFAKHTPKKLVLMLKNINIILYGFIFLILSSLIVLILLLRYFIRREHHQPHHHH